jgi:hypothetical protein
MSATLKTAAGSALKHHACEVAFEFIPCHSAPATGWIAEMHVVCFKALQHKEVIEAPKQDEGAAGLFLQQLGRASVSPHLQPIALGSALELDGGDSITADSATVA